VLTACSGGDGTRAARAPATAPPATTPPATVPTTTVPVTLPPVTEIPRPADVGEENFRWYVHDLGGGTQLLLAVRRSAETRRHPAVLLPDTSGGFNLDYLDFANELVARGFDVAVGCLFTSPDVLDPQSRRIPCATAPLFDGVADTVVADLDALVAAAYGVLGRSTPLALMGFSRGAGITALRASAGRSEPVVLASGKYVGWNRAPDADPLGDVNVVDRIGSWVAPALVLHGTIDGAIPVTQAQDLEAALRAAGRDVEARYYDGAGHNLSGEPGVHDDLVARVGQFLCARLVCPG
jgi:dienelactone hydrolase